MKRVYLLIAAVAVLSAGLAHAQERELTNEVIASAGGSMLSSGMLVSWTIGEPIVTTLETTPLILTQGFHQPLDYVAFNGIAGVRVLALGEMAVYPNPARERFTLVLPGEMDRAMLDLIDERGDVVRRYAVVGKRSVIECSGVDQGEYRARVTRVDDGQLVATLPILIVR